MPDNEDRQLPVAERVHDKKDLLVWSLPLVEQEYIFDVLDGMIQTEAYLKGHPNVQRSSARVQGSWWLTRPNIKAARDEIVELLARESFQGLRALAPKCLSVLARNLSGDDESACRTAFGILDRIGIGPHLGLDVAQGRTTGLDEFLAAAERNGS